MWNQISSSMKTNLVIERLSHLPSKRFEDIFEQRSRNV